jgi:hypothetical protein
MPRNSPSALGDTTADRVMGHRPEVLEAWENLREALLGRSSTLPGSSRKRFAGRLRICFEYAGQMFGCLIGDAPATAAETAAFAAAISGPRP